MGLFNRDVPEEKKEIKNSTLQVVSAGVLPSTETIDKCADNKQVPATIRKEYWYKDIVHASLIHINSEGKRKIKHEMGVIDEIANLYEPDVYFYTPGENPEKEIISKRIDLVWSQALDNSDVEYGKPLRSEAMSSTNRSEIDQIDTRKETPKPATGLKKLLGIGV